jgi:hypothetical protein
MGGLLAANCNLRHCKFRPATQAKQIYPHAEPPAMRMCEENITLRRVSEDSLTREANLILAQAATHN